MSLSVARGSADSTMEQRLRLSVQACLDLRVCCRHLNCTQSEAVTLAVALLSEQVQRDAHVGLQAPAEGWQQGSLLPSE